MVRSASSSGAMVASTVEVVSSCLSALDTTSGAVSPTGAVSTGIAGALFFWPFLVLVGAGLVVESTMAMLLFVVQMERRTRFSEQPTQACHQVRLHFKTGKDDDGKHHHRKHDIMESHKYTEYRSCRVP